MKIDKALLDSGMDIPFPEAKLVIHPPKIKDISMIGQDHFYLGCELLNFSKDSLKVEDKSVLEDKTDFDIFMSIFNDKDKISLENRISAKLVLSLLFPDYELDNDEHNLIFIKDNEKFFINMINYEEFKDLLTQICCLRRDQGDVPGNYNTDGEMADYLKQKFMKARKKVAESKGEKEKDINIFQRYISILSVGLAKSKRELYNYTIYQLFDEYDRYMAKYQYDIVIQAKMARATGMDEPENWLV